MTIRKAKKWDTVIPLGADWERSIIWWVDRDLGLKKDLTGWTGKMQIRRRHGDDEVLAEISTANGRMALGADGSITLKLPAAAMTGIEAGDGVHDALLYDPTGAPKRRWEGTVDFTPAVTQ